MNTTNLKLLVDDIIGFLHQSAEKYKDITVKEVIIALKVVSKLLLTSAHRLRKEMEKRNN